MKKGKQRTERHGNEKRGEKKIMIEMSKKLKRESEKVRRNERVQ